MTIGRQKLYRMWFMDGRVELSEYLSDVITKTLKGLVTGNLVKVEPIL